MSMLTVKHVENGRQHIQMVRAVSFRQGSQDNPAILEAWGCTGIGGAVDASGYCKYGDGTVYVMNDAGRTVGSYDLG